MSDLPQIDTVEDILQNIDYVYNDDKKLTSEQIKLLVKLKAGQEPLLSVGLNDRPIFLEVVDMLNNIGFDKSEIIHSIFSKPIFFAKISSFCQL